MPKNNEDLWKVLENINQWITLSDNKALAVITGSGVAIVLIASITPDVKLIVKIIHSAGLLFLIGSIWFSYKTLNPVLVLGESDSDIYFGKIAGKSKGITSIFDLKTKKDAFISSFLAKTDIELSHDILDQVWANSKIIMLKMGNVKRSVNCFAFGILFIGVGFLVNIFA